MTWSFVSKSWRFPDFFCYVAASPSQNCKSRTPVEKPSALRHITSVNTEHQIHVAQSAQDRIAQLRIKAGKPGLVLRILVEGGGCAGFQYKMTLEDSAANEDLCFAGCVATDTLSLEFLKDSEVYFETGLVGAEFRIDNPNAASGCGCGLSFSAKSEI